MSKKKQINKRINALFQDIQAHQTDVEGSTSVRETVGSGRAAAAAARPIVRKTLDEATLLELPLRMGSENWASLEIIGDEDIWDEDAQILAGQVADQLELALENARLFQETERRAYEMEAINRIAQSLNDYRQIEEGLAQAGKIITELLGFDYLCFTLLDAHGKFYNVASCSEKRPDFNPVGKRFPATEDFVKQIEQRKDVFVLHNVHQQKKLPPLVQGAARHVGSKTIVMAPIWSRETLISIVAIHSVEAGRHLNPREMALLKTIISQIGSSVETARLFRLMQESEARFRDVALASADWVWEIDAEGAFTYCSDRVRNVLGYEPDEIIGKRPADFMAPEDVAVIGKMMLERMAQGERIVNMASRLITKDGRIVVLETTAVPIQNAQGQVTGYRGVYKDITERKNAETLQNAIYRISESALEANTLSDLLQNIHAAVQTVISADNFIIAIHDHEEDVLDFPYVVRGKKPSDKVSPLGRKLVREVIQAGQPLFLKGEQMRNFARENHEDPSVAADVTDWLGIPLHAKQAVIGVMVTYNDDPAQRINTHQKAMFNLLGTHVASALERFLAAEALARSEAALRALFAAMEDVILVVGKDTTYLRIAPTNPAGLYRPPDELLGKRMIDIFDEETAQYFQNAINQALATKETIKIEYPLLIEGKEVWFDAAISRLSEDEVFWVARDITSRKQAEENLRRRNEYLATAAEIGQLITSTLDLTTLFRRTVKLLAERFQYDHVAIFTLEEAGFNAILQEATGEVGKIMKENAHKLAVGSKSLVGQVTGKGEPIIINDTQKSEWHRFNPLLPDTRSEAGLPLKIGNRIIGVLDLQSKQVNAFKEDDIAILQILADQIAIAIDNARSYDLAQKAVLEMREADRMKSQFLANMSHELRTPLNSIIGFSRVILKGIDGPLTDLQKQDLTSIYNSGQHLLGLINDILDISRIEAGKMELSFEEVEVKPLVDSVFSTARGLVKDKPVKLVAEIPDDLPSVRADPMRIRQVLLNLVSNAAKFTEEGSITVTAETRTHEDGQSFVHISVNDTGPGISEEDQKKLFQPVSQVDASLTRKVGGSGLGLSISRHLVEMHGGEIGLTSVVGEGSSFFFSIPAYNQNPVTVTEEAADGAPRRVILSIDDDLQVVSLYERYLKDEGWQIIPLTNPKIAVEKAQELKPDVITLDIMMPEVNGWQVLQALKQNEHTRNIPVIVCSIVEEEEKGFSLGAADYLTKPILQDDLLHALGRLNREKDVQTILIIDDNESDRRLLDKLLADDPRYRVQLASDGKSGWESIQQSPPDAIILDLLLPDMDGFTILENLHADETLRDIPVILVTGAELNAEQEAALKEFGHQLMLKASISQEELLRGLAAALQKFNQG